ncbi:hypothetical protein LPB260_17960 [Pseudomonas sp. LPB0260]|uniref:hypothetical protein n=1 Tax=Pseudomonas sp. LPB0260 TaxID=2614442 RepID=UPI0015C2A2EC|nr:hypothetical protein [Pseudomonas sp. LPB0260]QLC72650.1 hypothetical protein LPB260_03010 [Pseudomonas sp. LPB0260]QLC75424.1 hypothetical protein LPB260_17960 [Pseudomonas sp. LPB0260]
METLNQKFRLTEAHIADYQRTGFVLLKQLFSAEMIDYLRKRVNEELETPTDHYQKGFDKLRYDLCNDDEVIFELLGNPQFQQIMRDLNQRTLFFTQGVGFGLKQGVSKGFSWHIESQSFGFNRSEDYATTLWAPLHRIDTKGQAGGMRYVPRDVISGEFMYDFIDPAVFRCLDERIKSGGIAFEDYVALRDEPLNSSGIGRLLEYFAVEDDYELGDALLFDKYVIHRSVPLGEGELQTRDAFSLRFIADDSRYDLARAKSIEIPRDHYGYAGPTKFHLEICKEDGSLIVDSPYFDADRERRYIFA